MSLLHINISGLGVSRVTSAVRGMRSLRPHWFNYAFWDICTGRESCMEKNGQPSSSSSSSPPPPLFLLLFWRIAVSQKFSWARTQTVVSFWILETSGQRKIRAEPIMDDLGEYRCCVWFLRYLEGIWEEGVVHSRRGNQTLIHFGGDSWSMIFFFLRERKRFLNCTEKRTLKAWRLWLLPACSANPINSLGTTQLTMMHWGVSSSRIKDADKPDNLQLGGLYGKDKNVSELPVFRFWLVGCFFFSCSSPHSQKNMVRICLVWWGVTVSGTAQDRLTFGKATGFRENRKAILPRFAFLFFLSSWGPLQN